MGTFSTKAVLGALVLASAVKCGLVLMNHMGRNPSSVEDTYEISIQSLAIDPGSRLTELNDVFLRATFAQNERVEFGRNEHWQVLRGASKPLNLKTEIKRSWIQKDDSMEFRMEIVQAGSFETVLVRCAQISREVSQYNRSYQCNVPGEATPVLTYRLAKKDAPAMSVAAINH